MSATMLRSGLANSVGKSLKPENSLNRFYDGTQSPRLRRTLVRVPPTTSLWLTNSSSTSMLTLLGMGHSNSRWRSTKHNVSPRSSDVVDGSRTFDVFGFASRPVCCKSIRASNASNLP